MEKSEIIKKFLSLGKQIDSKALDFFSKNPERLEEFLKKVEKLKEGPFVINYEFVSNFFKIRYPEIKILKEVKKFEGTFSVENLVSALNKRYEFFRRIFRNRLELTNLLSINKISTRTKNFSLIAMVREKDFENKTLTVEDTTGQTTVFVDSNIFDQIFEDEVIGMICLKEGERIHAKKIFWPDIPLKREIKKAKEDIYCFFISDFHLDSKQFKEKSYEKFLSWVDSLKFEKFYLFFLGDISSREKDIENLLSNLPKGVQHFFLKGEVDAESKIFNLPNPAFLKIEEVTLLLFHGENLEKYLKTLELKPEEVIVNLIKKRHLDPTFLNEFYEEDPFLVDIVPDIVVAGHLHKSGTVNYKGTTIIANGSFLTQPIYYLINLRTREVIEKDFS